MGIPSWPGGADWRRRSLLFANICLRRLYGYGGCAFAVRKHYEGRKRKHPVISPHPQCSKACPLIFAGIKSCERLLTINPRFERVACAQKVGFKNREIFHKTDWEAVSKDPKALFRQWAPWLFNHDPEAYVAQKYDECAEYILNGKPFKTENAVPGHTFKAWTVKEFMEASESGKIPDDDGEWF